MSTAQPPGSPATPLDDDPILGLVINGKFRILEAVTEGGMGRIYRGIQEPLGRPVAVKVVHRALTASSLDGSFQKRFFLEASLLSKLQHPNIVTVYDYGKIENLPGETFFMAMEWLGGETLSSKLANSPGRRLPPQEACRIAKEVARGLREAHRHGIVHRDLKPGNLMLVPEEGGAELVKILDFGLVKVVVGPRLQELTQDNSLLGSPHYMAPEQVLQNDVDARTDLYALGVILYQMLCGKLPFNSKNSMEVLMGHVKEAVPRLADRVPGLQVPERIEQVAFHCLEKSPANRPASAERLGAELRECERVLGWAVEDGSGDHSGSRPALPGFRSERESPTVSATGRGGKASTVEEAGARTMGGIIPAGLERPPGSRTLSGEQRPEKPPGSRTLSGYDGVEEEISLPSVAGPAPAKKSRLGLILAGVGLVAAVVSVGGFFLLRAGTAAAPVPAPAAGPAVAPGAPALLKLSSEPAGAQVFERETLLGKTPLALPLDSKQSRTFTLRAEGFEPYQHVQGPGAVDAELRAVLMPKQAAPGEVTPAPTPATPPKKATPAGGKGPPKKRAANKQPDDINLER